MKKEKYPDGRDKILIAWYEKGSKKTLTLPKPEILRQILMKHRGTITVPINLHTKKSKNQEPQNRALSEPKVHDKGVSAQ